MDDSRKAFKGNFENGTTILPPRITNSRSRGYVAPSRRRLSTGDGEDEERLSNQKKQRYWNSYEEMYLVELWGCYKDEVTEFNMPLPVHRKIMVGMRTKDMMVTGQDCRRKINTLHNRYKTELQRMKLNGVKPTWRLFPLIHCVMEPKVKEFDAWHETKIVKNLLDKIPKPPELKTLVATPTTPGGPTSVRQPLQNNRSAQLNVTPKSAFVATSPLQSMQTYPKVPTHNIDNANKHPPFPVIQTHVRQAHTKFHSPYPGTKSNLPFRDITLRKYEQIKLANQILAEQRDTALKRLHLEEESLKAFESMLIDYKEQNRKVLQKVGSLTMGLYTSGQQVKNNGPLEQSMSLN